MSTPATHKKIEEAKKKAMERKAMLGETALRPLSDNFSKYREKKNTNLDFTDDVAAGRNYTSFEKKPYGKGNKASTALELVEIPPGEQTDDYIVDPNNIVCFNGKEHFLSALYPSPLLIDSHEYGSVEHYYQACKLYTLAGSQYALQLRNIKEPIRVKNQAKNILRSLGISNQIIEEWKRQHGFIMLLHANIHKFVQNSDLNKMLIETGEAILVHSYDRDNFYAAGLDQAGVKNWATENEGKTIKIPANLTLENSKYIPLIGKGKNILGCMAMKIRKQTMTLETKKKAITLDEFLPPILANLDLKSQKTENLENENTAGTI